VTGYGWAGLVAGVLAVVALVAALVYEARR